MKRLILSIVLATALGGTATSEAFVAPIDCKEIFRRCVNDCREVFGLDVMRDACAVGCYLGYMQCE